jgi:uncharacterized protein YceH (UPF0502 family)
METKLDAVEARILGVLIEKEMSTPDYYPLTLNGLMNGCNQKNNRNPVMALPKESLLQALGTLRKQRLVWQIMTHGSRKEKFEHNLSEFAGFSNRELAIVCELLVRGPQTAGELNTRIARFMDTQGIAIIELALKKLAEHEKGPFVAMLPKRPGHKEHRYTHLFSEVDLTEDTFEPVPVTATQRQRVSIDRVESLEKKLADLQTNIEDLKEQFLKFKSQFE